MPSNPERVKEFTRYYEQHKNAIFNYILYRIGFDRDTAEDLTSEIFLKAFEYFASYDTSRPFKNWIFTIAHNHLVNYYTTKRETLPLEDVTELVKTASATDTLENHMTIEKILMLMTKLPPAQRDLIIMRYVNDLSNREIAEILHKEEGALRTALSRALTALRQQYHRHFQKLSHESL